MTSFRNEGIIIEVSTVPLFSRGFFVCVFLFPYCLPFARGTDGTKPARHQPLPGWTWYWFQLFTSPSKTLIKLFLLLLVTFCCTIAERVSSKSTDTVAFARQQTSRKRSPKKGIKSSTGAVRRDGPREPREFWFGSPRVVFFICSPHPRSGTWSPAMMSCERGACPARCF